VMLSARSLDLLARGSPSSGLSASAMLGSAVLGASNERVWDYKSANEFLLPLVDTPFRQDVNFIIL
jgi:hypothetical protein